VCRGEFKTSLYYPIKTDLEYRLMSRRNIAKVGHGRTVSLSSGSILFESGEELPRESSVELFIAWPALLNGTVGLQLWVFGRTVHSQDRCTAVEIMRHHFRTRRVRSHEDGRAGRGLRTIRASS
jgi:hypothetical protein